MSVRKQIDTDAWHAAVAAAKAETDSTILYTLRVSPSGEILYWHQPPGQVLSTAAPVATLSFDGGYVTCAAVGGPYDSADVYDFLESVLEPLRRPCLAAVALQEIPL